jgi:hypothetical protein
METPQTHCHATATVTLLWKRHQGPNMSHCTLLKAARPEQPPGTAPICPGVPPSFSTGGAVELGRRRR